MEKRVFCFLLFFVLILYTASISAVVGISPGKYDIDFEPMLEKNFAFTFIFDSGVEAEVYVQGDLVEYVTLSTNKLVGGGSVIATLKLPYKVEKPGINKIAIGARQLSGISGGFALAGNVLGVINVRVPYPGKYAEIKIETSNANAGEPVKLKVVVDNLGTEEILTKTYMEIYDSQKNFIETINLGNDYINSKDSVVYEEKLDTSNYKAGDYNVKAFVEYDGKKASDEKTFRLGELYVGIINYTREFERNKINRFEIQVESFWNARIENIFANVSIVNYSVKFLTPSANLNPWQKETLVGFFDSSSIKEDEFQAEIVLNYDGSLTKKTVDLRFKEIRNYTAIIVESIITVLTVLIIVLLIVMFYKRKKVKKSIRKEYGRKK